MPPMTKVGEVWYWPGRRLIFVEQGSQHRLDELRIGRRAYVIGDAGEGKWDKGGNWRVPSSSVLDAST